MRIARIIGYVLAGGALLLILLAVGAAVALSLIDFNRYKPVIADAMREATGRELVISGDLRLEVSFPPSVVVSDVTLSNAAWGARPQMVSVGRLEGQIALGAAMRGIVAFSRIDLADADILLEVDETGRANFDFAQPGAAPQDAVEPPDGGPGADLLPLTAELRVRDSRLLYANAATATGFEADVDSLVLRDGGLVGPLTAVYEGRINAVPLRARASLGGAAGVPGPGAPWPAELHIEGPAVATMKGSVAEPFLGGGLDLEVSLTGDSTAALSDLAGFEIPELGDYSLSAHVTGDAMAQIRLAGLRARAGAGDLAGDATVDFAGDTASVTATLASKRLELDALGRGVNATLRDTAAVLALRGDRLAIEEFETRLSGARISAAGTIASLSGLTGLQLTATARGDRFADLAELAGRDLPALGAYSLSARIGGDAGGRIEVSGLAVRLGQSDISGSATVFPADGGRKLQARLASKRIDLAALGIGQAPLRDAAAVLALQDGALAIDSFRATLAGAALDLAGTIAEPAAVAGLDLSVAARGDRFADLAELAGRDLPALGAYSVSARIGGDAGGRIEVSGLAVRLGDSDISGSATVFLADGGRRLQARLASKRIDLAALGIGQAPLRDTAAVLALQDGALAIDSFRGTLAGAALDLAGTIADPAAVAGLDLSVTAKGRQLADLSALAGAALPEIGAYSVTGRLRGNPRETFRLTAIRARLGESDLAGDIAVTLSGDRPRIDADLTSGRIDLVGLRAIEPTPPDAAAGKPEPKPERLFPDDPLPLDWLGAADATVRYDAATVIGRQPLMTDAAVALSLNGGRLEVQSVKAVLQNGILDGGLSIDGRKTPPGVTARMALRKVDLAVLLAQTTKAGNVQGQVNLEFDLAGRGNSIRQIMAGLDGQLLLAMGKGQVRSRTLQTWVGGPTQILSNVLRLNVRGNTKVNCALASFYIKQGLATSNGLLLDTEVAAFVGKGTVNLKTEAVDMIIDPKVKRMTLSAAVPVHIRGSLMRPVYSLDDKAVALRVGGLLGGLVYPPALIIGLGELGTFRDGDCVGMTAPPTQEGTGEQAAPTTEQGPKRLPGRIIQGTGDSITRGLQRLFGQ